MYTMKKCKIYLLLTLLCTFLFSCSSIDFELPQGPQGANGKSAYEIWKEEVETGHINWPSTQVDLVDFLVYIKGEKGDKGKDGISAYDQWKALIAQGDVTNPHDPSLIWPSSRNTETDFWDFLSGRDGQSPHIGENGNWYIGNKDTKIRAAGKDGMSGKDGLSAYELWKQSVADGNIDWPEKQTAMEHFFLYFKGKDGGNGITPHVGENGHWYVGSRDTNIAAQGQKGEKGDKGASAYELWVNDVKNDKIKDKNNSAWPKDKIAMTDFYTYLSGTNGNHGKSAYELWKEIVVAGHMNDPKNPGQKWPSDKVLENDFFNYLAGKDGKDGINGLSAYELWKNDLAKRCGTTNALTDYRNGGVWDCDKNTLDDFYDYLRGKDGNDGKDGQDGRPGETGKPGAEVTIIKGIPNVIAQYSQSEFGEYVRTTDGGVLYKVYDEAGQIAPKAQVKGMPGIKAEKTYIADENGEFIIPKEDLPEIQDMNLRWGTVKEVTIAGKAPQESAKNTYVPNRVRMRMVLRDNSNSLSSSQALYFYIQRKVNPEDEWQNIPSYLPNSGVRNLDAYRVSDKNNPGSILSDRKIHSSQSTPSVSGNGYHYMIYTYRFMEENPGKFKNGQSEYWDGSDVYYTVKARDPYYGETFQWNGVCLLAPYQMGPTLKTLKLKTVSTGEAPSFSSAEGELDFSKMDFTRIYQSSTERVVKENGMDYVEPIVYTEEEARKLKMAYIVFRYTSTAGSQEASSSNNQSSEVAPTFKVFAPFLNSYIYITNSYTSYFYQYYHGYIRKGTDGKTFFVEKYNSSYEIPEVQVIYEE